MPPPDASGGGVSTGPVTLDAPQARPPAQAGETPISQNEAERLRLIAERDTELKRLEAEIATTAAYEAALLHRQLEAIRAFDELEGWADYGRASPAAWLSWRIGLNPLVARERVRVARALGRLPLMSEALRSGKISFSKARAMTRVATPENEIELLYVAQVATARELEWVCSAFRGVALEQIEGKIRAARMEKRRVRFRKLEDGMIEVTAVLFPEEAGLLALGLDHAVLRARRGTLGAVVPGAEGGAADGARDATPGGGTEVGAGAASGGDPEAGAGAAASGATVAGAGAAASGATVAGAGAAAPGAAKAAWRAPAPLPPEESEAQQRSTFNRADALCAIFRAFVEHSAFATGRTPNAEIFVQIPREALAGRSEQPGQLRDGTPIGAETARRLACDAVAVEVVHDETGKVLDIGRRSRSITTAIGDALRYRDKHCIFPGCDQDLELDGHHVKHWAAGGETSLENLVLLCKCHHWYVHEGGCSMATENGRFVFYDPRGRRIENAPPLLSDGDPGAALLAWLEEHGPGPGISLPIPARNAGDQADWSISIDALGYATYGWDVVRGKAPAVPRMPGPDGRPPQGGGDV
ncbi:HNH endonuclease signature motif containing protein [Vulgatibacter sp.]|uniref:HNH endonuclease signature motif containing protein n=1 Tax=Vulgatibacter sp. TaxID=1971226 RepID=UPI00356AFF2E